MKTITYDLSIVGYDSGVTVRHAKDSRNAILAVDTSKFEGSKYNINYKDHSDRTRFAKVEEKSIRGIRIRSNSPEILITDIIRDGIPFYYKTLNRYPGAASITVNGSISPIDNNFVYSQEKIGTIKYKLRNGTELESFEEFVPVYINENNHFNKPISDIDNKLYTYIQDTNKDFIISCPNPEVAFTAIPGELILVEQYSKSNKDHLSFILKDFYKEKKVSLLNRELLLAYRQEPRVSEVIRIINETAFLSNNIIQLNNSNLLPEHLSLDFKIQSGIKTIRVNKEAIINNKGQINIQFLNESIPNEFEYIKASYNYISPKINNIEIPIRIVNNSSFVKLYIKPTQNGSKICAAAFDKFGVCVYNTMGIDIPKGIVNIKNGEGKYLDKSGNTLTSISNIGSIIDDKAIFLEVATVFKKDIQPDFAFSGRISRPKKDSTPLHRIIVPKMSYLKIVLGKDYEESVNAGVAVIRAGLSTNATITKYSSTDTTTTYKIDISKDKYSGNPIDYVEDEDLLRFVKYKIPSFLKTNTDGYKIIFNEAGEKTFARETKRVIDGNDLYITVDTSTVEYLDSVSVGFNSIFNTIEIKE